MDTLAYFTAKRAQLGGMSFVFMSARLRNRLEEMRWLNKLWASLHGKLARWLGRWRSSLAPAVGLAPPPRAPLLRPERLSRSPRATRRHWKE
jgi:hypothetical protein